MSVEKLQATGRHVWNLTIRILFFNNLMIIVLRSTLSREAVPLHAMEALGGEEV
jgi:hypothetical protein